jgi:hypothetical protein
VIVFVSKDTVTADAELRRKRIEACAADAKQFDSFTLMVRANCAFAWPDAASHPDHRNNSSLNIFAIRRQRKT